MNEKMNTPKVTMNKDKALLEPDIITQAKNVISARTVEVTNDLK